MRAWVLACVLVAACDSGPSNMTKDMAIVIDMTFKSNCGHPGDVGNSLGVGKFCQKITDCSANTKATLCTTLGDPDNFFCTFACKDPGDAGTTNNECGENARCECSTGGCGCYPTTCP